MTIAALVVFGGSVVMGAAVGGELLVVEALREDVVVVFLEVAIRRVGDGGVGIWR